MEEVHPRNIGVDQNALLDTIHFPIHLEKENTLRVAYQFRFDDSNDFGRYAFYKIYSRIQFVAQNGQQEEMEVEMHYIPEFQKKDILKYIAERREE